MALPSKKRMILRSPIQFSLFAYTFVIRVCIILATRILLPSWPRYQSLRTELQRAYLASCTLQFPDLPNRLPAEYSTKDARPISGQGWTGYLIPGNESSMLEMAVGSKNSRVVLFAHGGGYARGVARMYVPYMKRWVSQAHMRGLDLVFLSVEYTLSTKAPHPRQRNEFVAAYQYLLKLGIPSSRITFMGDSAGGHLCTNTALVLPKYQLPQPSCTVLVSPWMDLAMDSFQGGNSAVTSDYFVQANTAVPALIRLFLGSKVDGKDPDVNPLYRDRDDVSVLNPQLIFVGGAEFTMHDSKTWTRLCREAGVKVDLQAEWGQLHVWALGSKWIEPGLRMRTDRRILDFIDRP